MAPVDNDSDQSRLRGFRFNFNFGCAIGVTLFGIAIWVLTPYQVEKAVPLFGLPASGLDPHLFPRMIGMFVTAFGVWYFFRSFKLDEENLLLKLNREAIINTVVSLITFLLFAYFIETLGFVISGALTMFFLSTFYGNRTYWLGALVSIAVPFGVFNLFTKGMLVFLPEFPYADLGWL